MHFDMPIEQVVRRVDTRFQLGFANEAKELIEHQADFVLEPAHTGLVVLARNEEALAAPVHTLRDIYGSSSKFDRHACAS